MRSITEGMRRPALMLGCTAGLHAGLVVDLIADAVGGDARSLVHVGLPNEHRRVNPNLVRPLDGLTEDEILDLMIDVICDDDDCEAR